MVRVPRPAVAALRRPTLAVAPRRRALPTRWQVGPLPPVPQTRPRPARTSRPPAAAQTSAWGPEARQAPARGRRQAPAAGHTSGTRRPGHSSMPGTSSRGRRGTGAGRSSSLAAERHQRWCPSRLSATGAQMLRPSPRSRGAQQAGEPHNARRRLLVPASRTKDAAPKPPVAPGDSTSRTPQIVPCDLCRKVPLLDSRPDGRPSYRSRAVLRAAL